MSWYRTGTVAVTNGSKTVTGVGTLFTTAVNAGDAFALVDANLNPTGAWYEVEAVVSNTEITLKQSYAGTTGSNNQYCVFNMVGNMTTPSFAQRLATFFASFQSLIDKPAVTPTAASIPIADANGDIDSGWLKDASETVKGAVELATAAEAAAGNDTTRAITPSTSGSRITFATTSTDDATSATAAPLKSAGGLAVAGNAWVTKEMRFGNTGIISGAYSGIIAVGKKLVITVTFSQGVAGQLHASAYGPSSSGYGNLLLAFGGGGHVPAMIATTEVAKVENGAITFTTTKANSTLTVTINNSSGSNGMSTDYYVICHASVVPTVTAAVVDI